MSHDASASAPATDDATVTHTFPPIPEERWITPASEDFQNPPKARAYLWPVVWIGVALLVGWLLADLPWTTHHMNH